MTNNPKLTPEQRRRLHYRKLYGLDKPESSGDLRTDMRTWVAEVDAEKKNKLSKVIPKKIDVDSITKSRMFYQDVMGGDDD